MYLINGKIIEKIARKSDFFCVYEKKVVPLQRKSCKDMNEPQLIEAINRSMQESAAQLRAMGREPYSVTREEAERQVAMLLKAKEMRTF